jgi:hypothetical protein
VELCLNIAWELISLNHAETVFSEAQLNPQLSLYSLWPLLFAVSLWTMVDTTTSSSFSCYLMMMGMKVILGAKHSVHKCRISLSHMTFCSWLGMVCSTNHSYPGFAHWFLTVVGLLDSRPCFELYNCLCVLECIHTHLYTKLSKLVGPIITSLSVKKMSASYPPVVMFRHTLCQITVSSYLFFVYVGFPMQHFCIRLHSLKISYNLLS